MLITGLCCLLLLKCKQSEERRADDCGDAAVARLGLLAEDPQAPCGYSASLIEREGELYYTISSQSCYVEPEYYRCDGTLACTHPSCDDAFRGLRYVRFLGWLPDPSDCAAAVTERLGLSPEVPDVACPSRVTLYLWRGEFYYLVVNIGPVCNSVDVAYTCDGVPICLPLPQSRCTAGGEGEVLAIRTLGYY